MKLLKPNPSTHAAPMIISIIVAGFGAILLLDLVSNTADATPAGNLQQQINTALTRLQILVAWIRNAVLILSAFAIIGVVVAALFGRMNWRWMWIIVGALMLLTVGTLVVEFLFINPIGTT